MTVSKGGSLITWDASGNVDKVLHYGPGMSKACPTCSVKAYVRCVSSKGRPNKKTHPARL